MAKKPAKVHRHVTFVEEPSALDLSRIVRRNRAAGCRFWVHPYIIAADMTAFSQAAVQPAEGAGQHERNGYYASPKDEHMPGLAQLEGPHTADQHVADGQVKETPQDVDR